MLLRALLGGYICQEAIEHTNSFYYDYIEKQKEKRRRKKEQIETGKKVGFSAVVVVGLVGAYFATGKKLLN